MLTLSTPQQGNHHCAQWCSLAKRKSHATQGHSKGPHSKAAHSRAAAGLPLPQGLGQGGEDLRPQQPHVAPVEQQDITLPGSGKSSW